MAKHGTHSCASMLYTGDGSNERLQRRSIGTLPGCAEDYVGNLESSAGARTGKEHPEKQEELLSLY